MRFSNKQVLFFILLIAFLLRFPGIFDGLPAAYNSTEYYHAKFAMSMGARQSLDPQISNYDVYNPRMFIYPMLYQYLVLIEYALFFIFGSLFGIFKDSYDFAIRFLVDPSLFYLLGRFINILISLVNVASVYLLMRKVYNKHLARFAALITALSYYFILASVQAVSDSCLLLFSTLATLYIIKSYHKPILKNLIITSIFTGLAIATKYNAGVLLFMFPLLFWIKWEKIQTGFIKTSLIIILVIFISFILPNPYWLIRFSQFIDGFRLVSEQANQAISPEMGLNYWWEFSQIVKGELLIGIGFFAALFYYLFKKRDEKFIVALVTLLTLLYVGSWQKKGIDYLYAVYPGFVLLSSFLFYNIWTKYFEKSIIKNVIIFMFLFPSLIMGLYQNVLKLRMDTREQATEWIVNHVGNHFKLCYDNYHYDLGVYDINRFMDYGAGASQLPEQVINKLQNFKDDKKNLHFTPVIYKLQDSEKKSGSLFEQESNMYGRKTINQLVAEGVEFLVTNDWYYNTYLDVDEKGLPPIIQSQVKEFKSFYSYLFENYKPLIIFTPDFWTIGPEIRIYHINLKNKFTLP